MLIEGDEEVENDLLHVCGIRGHEEVEGIEGKHVECLNNVEYNVNDREEAGVQASAAARLGLETALSCLGEI